MGFRRTGRGTHRRQNRTKSAADPRRCQPFGRQRSLPGKPQVADEPAGEAKLAVGRCHGPGEPVGLLWGAGPGQGPVQGLIKEADGVLDGLIASDKFCWTRYGRLRLAWWRRPLRLRSDRLV
jgi:hypothetical protein